jgi:hypothetical protein
MFEVEGNSTSEPKMSVVLVVTGARAAADADADGVVIAEAWKLVDENDAARKSRSAPKSETSTGTGTGSVAGVV